MNLPNPYESPSVDPRQELNDERGAHSAMASAEAGERITWLHGLLWVIAALFLFWWAGLSNLTGTTLRQTILLGIVSAARLITAMSLAAILLAAVRRYQRLPTFPAQFGHWLLLLLGTNWIVMRMNEWIPLQAIKAELGRDNGREVFSDPLAAAPWMQLAVSLVALIVPWLAIRYSRGEKHWQRFAIFYLLHQAWQAFVVLQGGFTHWTMLWISMFIGALTGGTFLLAAFVDLSHRRHRDQLHWLGLALMTFDFFLQRAIVFGLQWLMSPVY